MTLHFDKLIDRYIPTDSGWQFHPENTALLPSSEIDGKLVIEATNPLGTDYKQLMYSNVAAGGNATVYYLDMITSKDSGELPTIERDLDASNAKAIRLKPNTTMIFKTNYPYNKDRLKKVLCRCRKDTDATTTLHVGVVGIEDKAYKQPDGTYGNETFYEVTVSGEITESYVTYVGYILGTDSVENIALVGRPNNDPDFPAKLLDGTTDIALVIKTGDGIGDIYVDSIELQDTENALTELPKGRFVVGSLEGLTDDNKLSPVEKAYIKTLITEIDAEYTGILADGAASGVSSTFLTALIAKWDALHAIVNPLLVDMCTASDITSAFDAAFAEYYAAVNALEEQISIHTADIIESLDDRSRWEVQISGGPTVPLDSTPITLSAKLLRDSVDVTNYYAESDFDWLRITGNTPADLAWRGGVSPTGKTLAITNADLEDGRATFLCKFKYLYGGSSYYFKTGAVAISEEVPGPQGPQGEAYVVVVSSSNGDKFKPGESMTTQLRAHVFLNGEEITADIPDSWFRWRRKSFHEPNDDALWNSNHMAGYRTIEVTANDVSARATFFCDIVR
jgi:hypothetical protein